MSKLNEAKSLETSLLVRELKDVEWDTLGTYLELSQGEIREIERDHQNTGRRRIEMFEKWLSKEENPSWEKMIAALKDMDENSLASKLRKKYLYRQEPQDAKSQTPADQTPTGESVVVKVAVRQFNEIHNFASSFIFCTMVFCTGVLQYAFCFVYR